MRRLLCRWKYLSILFQVNQELGREGILPYSRLLASNEPFNGPLCGLFIQYLVSTLTVLLAPPGDAYKFTVNCKAQVLALLQNF